MGKAMSVCSGHHRLPTSPSVAEPADDIFVVPDCNGNCTALQSLTTREDSENEAYVLERQNVARTAEQTETLSYSMQRYLQDTGDAHVIEPGGYLLPWSSPYYRRVRHSEVDRIVGNSTGGDTTQASLPSLALTIYDSAASCPIDDVSCTPEPLGVSLVHTNQSVAVPRCLDCRLIGDNLDNGEHRSIPGIKKANVDHCMVVADSQSLRDQQRRHVDMDPAPQSLLAIAIGVWAWMTVYAIFSYTTWLWRITQQGTRKQGLVIDIKDLRHPEWAVEPFDTQSPQGHITGGSQPLNLSTSDRQQSRSFSREAVAEGRIQKQQRDDEEEDEDEDQRENKKHKKNSKGGAYDHKLPCPFHKADPSTYNKDPCKGTFQQMSHLCDHLSGPNHRLHFQKRPKPRCVGHLSAERDEWPPWARGICLKCLTDFKVQDQMQVHLETCRGGTSRTWETSDETLDFGSDWLSIYQTLCSDANIRQAWELYRRALPSAPVQRKQRRKNKMPSQHELSKHPALDVAPGMVDPAVQLGGQQPGQLSTTLEAMFENDLADRARTARLEADLAGARAEIATLQAERQEISAAVAISYPAFNLVAAITRVRSGQSSVTAKPQVEMINEVHAAAVNKDFAPPDSPRPQNHLASEQQPLSKPHSLFNDSGLGWSAESRASKDVVAAKGLEDMKDDADVDADTGADVVADASAKEEEHIGRFFEEAIFPGEIGLPHGSR